ncbi:MAG: hypothetical protein AAFZ49_19025 [Cyanobacteria bacterium J06659_2]
MFNFIEILNDALVILMDLAGNIARPCYAVADTDVDQASGIRNGLPERGI